MTWLLIVDLLCVVVMLWCVIRVCVCVVCVVIDFFVLLASLVDSTRASSNIKLYAYCTVPWRQVFDVARSS